MRITGAGIAPAAKGRDLAYFRAARSAEARAEALLPSAAREAARADVPLVATTRGPYQEVLRQVARREDPVAAAWFAVADEAHWAVVLHYEGMIRQSSCRHRRYWRGREDALLQEMRIGWYGAAVRFDPEAGFAFSSYADPYGHSQVQRCEERQAVVRQGETRQMRADGGWRLAPVDSLDDEVDDRPDDAPSPEDVAAAREMRDLLTLVDGRQQAILTARAEDRTLAEVGREIGLSKERVRLIERSAILQIREALRA